jgi:hypothetical protein
MTTTMKTRPVLYPFLIAAHPILSLYAQNFREIPLRELAPPIAIVLAIALVLWAPLALILKDSHRAGLLALLGLVFCGMAVRSTGDVELILNYLSGFWVQQIYTIPQWRVVVPLAAIFAVIAFLTWRRLKSPRAWTPPLNIFALVLVALPVISIVRGRWGRTDDAALPLPALATLNEPERRPDIYYIILDGFARGDVLKELYGYDLEPFLVHLEQKGFYVARQSTSNYCQTPLSITSSLNAAHLHGGVKAPDSGSYPDSDLFRNNAVIRALRPIGYKFVTFASGFDFTEYPDSDVYLSPYRYVSGFHRILLESTLFWRLLPNPMEYDSYTMTRVRTLFLFDNLPKVSKIAGPTFAFAHILAPHPPFVFGADGEDVSPHATQYFLNDGDLYRGYYGNESSYVNGYSREVAFLVKRVERMIDEILASSPEPPIIILQSDHGSGLHLSMGSDEATDHHERMSILNAYYLPGGKHEGLHDRITPVNSFRVVLNNYFGAHLDYLPNENYFSTWGEPFRFIQVTDRVSGDRAPRADKASRPGEGDRHGSPADGDPSGLAR